MAKIELGKEARDVLAAALSSYMKSELDLEVKGFDAVFLLDFVLETVGPTIYNQGLHDAQAIFRKKAELIVEAVYELEKPVKA